MYFENLNVLRESVVYISNHSDGITTHSQLKIAFKILIEVKSFYESIMFKIIIHGLLKVRTDILPCQDLKSRLNNYF